MPRALRAEPARCLACQRRDRTSHPLPSPHPHSRMPLPGPPGNLDLCSLQFPGLPRRVCLCLAWPLCQDRGGRRPAPLCVFPSPYDAPPASPGTKALSEHPTVGPGLLLNLPQETSSRCWRTGCSSGSLSAPGGRMEEEDLGGVKSRP